MLNFLLIYYSAKDDLNDAIQIKKEVKCNLSIILVENVENKKYQIVNLKLYCL